MPGEGSSPSSEKNHAAELQVVISRFYKSSKLFTLTKPLTPPVSYKKIKFFIFSIHSIFTNFQLECSRVNF